ncbi:urease accessory protein UreD [Kocuria tytonicola]|uniref:Urease accessory protein UreD n=1 Tax=Kocuria tytonicola TaxID=2055946 RepID=A0A3L9LBC4_9MICC|nr:urease accessory protein UreD [Kocuria tytonicola]RLY93742.1 urease accessory protein UreD [Kocuria tytonicola]
MPETPATANTTTPPASGWAGQLRLTVAARGGRSYAARQFHEGALRVLRPHYLDRSGQVTYTVVNPGGAYFGADSYLLDVAVERDASLALTTQSATKVYRTPQGPASQEMIVRLGPGAVLEYVPDQLIVYRGGSYIQRTRVDMDPTASLLLAEVVTPGWSPSGESFAYDELRMRTEVRVLPPGAPASSAAPEGAPPSPGAQVAQGVDPAVPAAGARPRRLVVDQLRIQPDAHGDITGTGFMEGHSHTGQLLIADARLTDEVYELLTAAVDASETRSGITRAGVGEPYGVRCVCVRSLAHSTQAIAALHRAVVDLLREHWRGQPPLNLRKY